MSKHKHAPGPWSHGIWTGKNTGISIRAGEHGTEPFAQVYGAKTEAIANAKLIAAAPDLLEALERIAGSGEFNGGTYVEELQGIAREAIRKATN